MKRRHFSYLAKGAKTPQENTWNEFQCLWSQCTKPRKALKLNIGQNFGGCCNKNNKTLIVYKARREYSNSILSSNGWHQYLTNPQGRRIYRKYKGNNFDWSREYSLIAATTPSKFFLMSKFWSLLMIISSFVSIY